MEAKDCSGVIMRHIRFSLDGVRLPGRISVTASLSLLLLAAGPWEAWAQSDSVLEEIVVTATKSGAQNLQDLPLSVAVLSGEDLDNSGIATTMGLQSRIPGLVITRNTHLGQPYIRGVGSDVVGPAIDGAVSVYVDGAYQARAASQIAALADVERVEVLKGPQGTLYGRNATGGAINIVTRKPTREFSARGDLQVGNLDQFIVRGSLSGPLVADRVFGRLSVTRNQDDGYTDNILLDKDGDDTDILHLRGALEFVLSDRVTLDVAGYHFDRETRALPKALNPETNPSTLFFGATVNDDPREVLHDIDSGLGVEQWGLNARLVWDFEGFTLTSVTTFDSLDETGYLDVDSTEIPLAHNGVVWPLIGEEWGEDAEFFSQEFVVNGESGGLQWTGLVNYYVADAKTNADNDLPLFGFAGIWQSEFDNEAFGAALQLNYALTEKFSATAGVRYSYEKKEFERSQGLVLGGAPLILVSDDSDASWKPWTPKFGIEYRPNEDVMVYASMTRGFRSGGFNLFAAQSEFDPEFIWSYEAGVKSTWWDGRMRLNAAAFYYDYKDLQLQTFLADRGAGAAATQIENAGEATLQGLDLDVVLQATEALTFEASLAFLDGELDEWVTVDPDRPTEGVFDRDGNAMPRAPDFTASLAVEHRVDLGDLGSLTLRGEFYHRDKIYFTAFEDARVDQGAIDLWNARLTFSSANDRWFVAAFGQNLGDEEYLENVLTVQALIGQIGFYAPPRTYGLQVGFSL
ncbi:MAG: TonB-dependent receptor [Gammaproteobacteria bacterium]|nr:TonB-dependent receptor [Gammaproteobacteria bacterium]